MSEQPISAEFPFEGRFVDVLGSRMHYVEAGSGDPILFLHGNPTSCYLWRNIIPYVSSLGRAIAPDLIGFGSSDKPDLEYRFFDHVDYVDGFIEALGLEDVTLVLHDWGSALGFHYAARNSDNVKGLAFMESIVAPIRSWSDLHPDMQALFRAFRTPDRGWELIVDQNLFIERVLPGAVVRDLSDAEMARYREPFQDTRSRTPVWRWPNEIPIEGSPPDVVEAVESYSDWLQTAAHPKLLFHAKPGTLMRAPVVEWCRAHFPNLETIDIGHGIHFVQEDAPHEIGAGLAEWIPRI